ncbi:MAG: hypothetical protein P1P89_18470 [Desulfobacterales bacterium]|nr:hypothetical protein [Desulfobacterales bacterium]
MDRNLFAGVSGGKSADAPVSYKDYFQAARIFLMRNKFADLTQAAAIRLERTVRPEEIREVRVSLEKHGQFYHPSRVDVCGSGFTAAFVLNVAISATGKAWIENEYHTIKKLKKDFTVGYLPEVYAYGEVPLKDHGYSIPMFLGEWFEGFNEFHLSCDPETRQNRIVAWDYKGGDFFLSSTQATNLFRQAAKILTFYYNPETFEQIFSWHHAAGDFVLKQEKDRITVRLITVRQYLKLFKNSKGIENKTTFALKALLIFFLQLSIRMRLDRLDGTGPVAWLGHEALMGTVSGFFEALAQKPPLPKLPVPITDGFKATLSILTEKELLGLLSDLAATYPPASPDIPAVQAHLEQHAADLYRVIHMGKI